ncbi:MAG TPA: clostripain-related cysteine peptidase [Burkholderiaceae bacterium]|nr:clostripain-related cysteine peptidase [Burkholderiaceae bacterium]
MRQLPTLRSESKRPDGTDSVVLAVYAPFGSDAVLSTFPDGVRKPIAQQPLVQQLRKVARLGVHVSALIDLVDDFSYLVEIPAGLPGQMRVHSTWKQGMSSPYALEGFLRHTQQRHPCAATVLALEGHGAGFLPDLDIAQITPASSSGNGQVSWSIDPQNVHGTNGSGGPPLLGVGYPELPVPSPDLPHVQLPMSTWGLGSALQRATRARGGSKLAVIHFDNCFNMSLEVLHTVADHADYATSYCNYNFFSAGAAYPKVFARLRAAGSATRGQLAHWFALENQSALSAPPFFPTVGAAIRLSRMRGIVAAVNTLADAMTAELKVNRGVAVPAIRSAIVSAQQYDTGGSYELETPDQLTDLMSLASALQRQPTLPPGVTGAAAALEKLLAGVKQYGDNLLTSVDPSVRWNFSSDALAMNILLPDPALQGRWDWRSPYYGVGPTAAPAVQRNAIAFLTPRPTSMCSWVDFLIEYHRDVPFVALLRVLPPFFPPFNPRFDPQRAKPIPRPGAVPDDRSDKAA